MAIFNLGSVGNATDLQQIKSYLFRLDKQLQYCFTNLDVDENFNERSKLIFAATEDIQATIEVTLEGIRQTYATKEAVASIELTVDGISQSYVTKDGVVSAININEQGVKIEGRKIDLVGTVTANDYFLIKQDGSMEAVNGTFSGTITASTIKIGGTSQSPEFHVTDAGAVTAKSITISGGSIKGPTIEVGGNANANGTFTVKNASGNTIGTWDMDGLSITSGSINLGLVSGSNPAEYRFSVTNAGAVTASNLTLSGGSINLNNAFTVSNQGVVTIKSGSINLGEISGSNPTDYKFKVTSGGNLTAVDAVLSSATVTGTIKTKGTGTEYPFARLQGGVWEGGHYRSASSAEVVGGRIVFEDSITKIDPTTQQSSSISAMTLESDGVLLCGGVFTALASQIGQSTPVYQGISRADSQHVITGADSGSALINIAYDVDVDIDYDTYSASLTYYPLQMQFVNGLLVSCALQNRVSRQIY